MSELMTLKEALEETRGKHTSKPRGLARMMWFAHAFGRFAVQEYPDPPLNPEELDDLVDDDLSGFVDDFTDSKDDSDEKAVFEFYMEVYLGDTSPDELDKMTSRRMMPVARQFIEIEDVDAILRG
jgi:hypothetical protein